MNKALGVVYLIFIFGYVFLLFPVINTPFLMEHYYLRFFLLLGVPWLIPYIIDFVVYYYIAKKARDFVLGKKDIKKGMQRKMDKRAKQRRQEELKKKIKEKRDKK